MANPNQAVTIADMAAGAVTGSKYLKGSLHLLENMYQLSDSLPFLNLNGQQTATVPRPNPDQAGTVFYRNVNGKYTYTNSRLEKFTEDTALLTYAFNIDTVTNNDPSYSLFKPGPTNMSEAMDQMALEMMDAMINGDPTVAYQTDPDGFDLVRVPGIRYRLDNGFNGIDPGCLVDSKNYNDGITGLDITGTGSAAANNLVDAINETASLIGATHAIVNYRMQTMLKRATRVGNMLMTTKDTYDRPMDEWNGVKFIVPTLRTASRSLRGQPSLWVLPWEDTTGAPTPAAAVGSRYGSIYFLRISETDGFTGLTVNGMSQRGPEKLPIPAEAVAYSGQYGIGFATLGVRCIARIKNIKIN